MSTDSVLDAITFSVLSNLYKEGPMRYVQLKTKLNVSDSSLTSRLTSLTNQKLVTVEAILNETGRNYFVYKLTEAGTNLVKTLNIPKILEQLEDLSLA